MIRTTAVLRRVQVATIVRRAYSQAGYGNVVQEPTKKGDYKEDKSINKDAPKQSAQDAKGNKSTSSTSSDQNAPSQRPPPHDAKEKTIKRERKDMDKGDQESIKNFSSGVD
eukprot:TRINITY_DN72_c0_g1_i4.p1 TRINITY_DN72_c0_g1~~TRINITY_DN72_c0_g1_i4.p1  ORF type:complete len:111 (-),score=48.74 TRINITY_DN72_c0_g1_i4:82-414(-)